jgi:hypothetical protein
MARIDFQTTNCWKEPLCWEESCFSQDDDLLKLAAQWQYVGKQFQGVIYAHQLSGGIGELIRDLELMLNCCETDELVNQVNYLPLN